MIIALDNRVGIEEDYWVNNHLYTITKYKGHYLYIVKDLEGNLVPYALVDIPTTPKETTGVMRFNLDDYIPIEYKDKHLKIGNIDYTPEDNTPHQNLKIEPGRKSYYLVNIGNYKNMMN